MLSDSNRTKKRFFNKLSFRNVKKSAKDYFIYFFTLTLSVCLFYSFNSVSAQFAALGLKDTMSYLSFSSGVLTALSVLVCFVMGALVVYANRFLLKRRKKEMGIYATLGLERGDINRLLMRETFWIGVVSLAAGLVVGIFAAQILSLLTASLAGLGLADYRFIISIKAIVLSILFFSILFFFVHLFNVKELKKISLLEMLYADRKNETVSEGNGWLTPILSILSAVLILTGYGAMLILAESNMFKALALGGLLLIAGTVFFFTSVLRLVIGIRKKNKRYYYHGINLFTISQLSSRLKADEKTIAMTAILLFLSLSLMIIGPGGGKFVMNGVENAAPYGGSISLVPQLEQMDTAWNPMAGLEQTGFTIKRFSNQYESFWVYRAPSATSGFLTVGNESDPNGSKKDIGTEEMENPLAIIGVEDYNRLLALQGIAPVYLQDGEFGINYVFPAMQEPLEDFKESPKTLKIRDTSLTLAQSSIWNHAWENRNVLLDQGTLIIPQNLTESLKPQRWILDFNFLDEREDMESELLQAWIETAPNDYRIWMRQETMISLMADNLLLTYLGLYLGITFLITSGAVLALQQLSQSTDNVKHFGLLKKLGVTKAVMKASLMKKLCIYFGFPLILAMVHTAVTISAVFRNFQGLGAGVTAAVVGGGMLMVLGVYAVYFFATYLGSRKILDI